jgi:hypothetical protein
MIVMIAAGSIAAGSGAALAADSTAMPSVVAADFMAVSVDADSSHESLVRSASRRPQSEAESE